MILQVLKCFVADIRVYRPELKEGNYRLCSFEGNTYGYSIKNIRLNEMKGVRTIVPISFINKDRYHIGIHRDKLLSNPKIIYEENGYVSRRIDKLWHTTVENLYDEAMRLYGELDLNRMNILNSLVKKQTMTKHSKESINNKTRFYLSKIK